jgi:spore coat protein U-like protein
MLTLNRKLMAAAGALSLTLLMSTTALAANTTGTLGATIIISTNCNISSTSQVDFGTVDPTAASNASGTGNISVKCTKGTTLTDIKLDAGGNFAGGTRQMANAGSFVAYALFTDSAHTTAWGDSGATIAAADLSSGFSATTSASVAQSYSVYGLVLAAAEDVPAATYNDTVNITVDF